ERTAQERTARGGEPMGSETGKGVAGTARHINVLPRPLGSASLPGVSDPGATAGGFDRRRSLEVGRRRVVAILARLAGGACDQADLADIVPNRKNLSRIMAKLVRRGLCYVTTIQTPDIVGGPRRVYCLYKVNTPSHDNVTTKILRALGW